MGWPPMCVVWSVTQVSSFGAFASAGVFASAAAFASAAGLESLAVSCAAIEPELIVTIQNASAHMVKNFFISAPFDRFAAPIIAAGFYAAWERQVKRVTTRGAKGHYEGSRWETGLTAFLVSRLNQSRALPETRHARPERQLLPA